MFLFSNELLEVVIIIVAIAFTIYFLLKKVFHVKRSKKKISSESLPVSLPDIIEELTTRPMTTMNCATAVKEEGLENVRAHPEKYIEINMIERSEVVDSFYLPISDKSFSYGKKGRMIKHNIKEDCLLLLPLKDNKLMLCAVFTEKELSPISFKQTNKGITANALSLLYNPKLYAPLLSMEEDKYNFWIVIMMIISTIVFCVGIYLLFFHNGGVLPAPAVAPASPIIPPGGSA